MKDTELAYLAGIIDGEGSIELRMQRTGSLDLVLHVFNSDAPLFRWIEERFAGTTYEIHRRLRVDKPQWAPMYNWNMRGESARDLLAELEPWMVIKKPQADLAIEAFDNRQPVPRPQKGEGRRGRARPSDTVLALRKSYVDQMHFLNTKNRGKPNA